MLWWSCSGLSSLTARCIMPGAFCSRPHQALQIASAWSGRGVDATAQASAGLGVLPAPVLKLKAVQRCWGFPRARFLPCLVVLGDNLVPLDRQTSKL